MGMVIYKKYRSACDVVLNMGLQERRASIACCRPKPVFPEVPQTLSVYVKIILTQVDGNSQCAVALVSNIVVWDRSVHILRYGL